MKKLLLAILLIIIIVGAGGYYYYQKGKIEMTVHKSNQILAALKAGNQRFVSKKPRHHDYQKQILNTKDAQHPEAVVLSCIDSRSIPELAFDQGIGEILTIRTPGNVVTTDVLGGMEFGTKLAGAKLIVVLGHTNCGAVTAACKGEEFGNLTPVLEQIKPAVQTVETTLQEKNCADPTLINASAKQNVINMVNAIPQQSKIVANLVKAGKLRIVGAMYDVATGEVTFLDKTEIQAKQ